MSCHMSKFVPMSCQMSVVCPAILGIIEVSACPKFHFLLIRVVQLCPYVLSNVCRLSGNFGFNWGANMSHILYFTIHLSKMSLCLTKCLSSVQQIQGIPTLTTCYSLTCMIIFVFMNICTSRKKMITIQEYPTKNTDYLSTLCQFLTPK